MSRWTLPPLSLGEFAPEFAAPTRANAEFHASTLAGRYVLLGFVPADGEAEARALADLQAVRRRMDDRHACAFLISPRASFDAVPPDDTPGVRWFLDSDGAVRRLYSRETGWLLLDPALRVMASAPLDAADDLFAQVAALPPPGQHAGRDLVAPVLIVPRVFSPEFCRTLMDYYDTQGGQLSGVMRDVDGKTVGVLDSMKRRRDVQVVEPTLKAGILRALERQLAPMIERTFHFKATRLERYLVACYDAEEGGFFRPHRDNQSFGTAHRKFAVSINLNSEEFEGGDLRFPEFGPRTYRPPSGGAVVFCCSLMHEATPVTKGRRYAVLPFLYDAAGDEIRMRNLHKLERGPEQEAATGG